MTTWDNGDVTSRKTDSLSKSHVATYTISGIIGDTGGTLTTTGFKSIDNYSVKIYYRYGSTTIYTATSNGAADGTTIINTAHTQGNDYWNQHIVEMVTGTCAGETSVISDFTAASDTITLTGAGFSAQIDSGDTYRIISVGYNTNLTHYFSGKTITVAYDDPLGAHTVKIKVWGLKG